MKNKNKLMQDLPEFFMNSIDLKVIRRNARWLLRFTTLAVPFLLTSCVDRSEKHIRENFSENFPAFEKLEQMQQEDINTYYISYKRYATLEGDGIKENQGLSDERIREYRKLLKQANIEVIGYNYTSPKRTVRFGEIDTDLPAYYFLEEAPPSNSIFNSRLECAEIRKKEHYTGRCYLFLKNNWYYG